MQQACRIAEKSTRNISLFTFQSSRSHSQHCGPLCTAAASASASPSLQLEEQNPKGTYQAPIRVSDSLRHGQKVPLTLSQPGIIHWYACGPTVYDASHLGHARNYVSFDILQRILNGVFGIPVRQVMGMTDVDDKIVKRAAEKGAHFLDVARQYEHEFCTDMKALGVNLPPAITRVSEHIPEIIDFVKRIESNGFAYVTSAGVYFDSKAFESAGYKYGKLAPPASSSSFESDIEFGEVKKDARDFALWKSAPIDQPGWPSPWGFGRPGWHIECSAMSSSLFGHHFDVHSGGIDLQFPHHNNEIAQCEAGFELKHGGWCTHFIHSGHLHISGLKMSKSLKNFITIRQYLSQHSSRSFRLFCLMHRYDHAVDYSEETMARSRDLERRLLEFSRNCQATLRQLEKATISGEIQFERKFGFAEQEIESKFIAIRHEVKEALADNFDTPTALSRLVELIHLCNVSLLSSSSSAIRSPLLRSSLLHQISSYVLETLGHFGVEGLHVSASSFSSSSADESFGSPLTIPSLIDITMDFRSSIKTIARSYLSSTSSSSSDPSALAKQLLQHCDNLRDETLPNVGIRLEDERDGSSRWKMETVEEKEQRIIAEKLAVERAEKQREEARKKREQEKAEALIPPSQYFRRFADLYSQFDQDGVPTHDAKGEAVSKSASKKLKKEWEKHVSKHTEVTSRLKQQ